MFLWILDLGAWCFSSGIHDCQGSIKNRQADDFGPGDVWAVSETTGREEERASGVSHA